MIYQGKGGGGREVLGRGERGGHDYLEPRPGKRFNNRPFGSMGKESQSGQRT